MRTVTAAKALKDYGLRWAVVTNESGKVYSLHISQIVADVMCADLNEKFGKDTYSIAKIVD